MPDPIESIKGNLSGLTQRQQDMIIREAMQQKRMPLSIDGPEFQAFLRTPEGIEKIVAIMFQKYQPDMTIDQIWEVQMKAVEELGENYVEGLATEA